MSSEDQDRISEIRARLEAATPGPWVASEGDGATWVDSVGRNGLLVCNTGVISNRYSTANTRLIANAPADLAYLLAELAAAQAREQALRRVARVSQGIIHEGLHGGRATDPEHQEMCEMPACRNIRAALAGGQGEG